MGNICTTLNRLGGPFRELLFNKKQGASEETIPQEQ